MIRDDVTPGRTIGKLSCDGAFLCFTLEDPVRTGPKIAHETAIPEGRYDVIITKSQRFGVMLPLLLRVPGFEGIRIHSGNTTADTSGCLLVGLSRDHDSIASSRIALGHLQPMIAGELARGKHVYLTIKTQEHADLAT